MVAAGDGNESESEVTQSCPTLHDPMDCSPPGSSIHGTFQARVLEWVAIAFSEMGIEARKRDDQQVAGAHTALGSLRRGLPGEVPPSKCLGQQLRRGGE